RRLQARQRPGNFPVVRLLAQTSHQHDHFRLSAHVDFSPCAKNVRYKRTRMMRYAPPPVNPRPSRSARSLPLLCSSIWRYAPWQKSGRLGRIGVSPKLTLTHRIEETTT